MKLLRINFILMVFICVNYSCQSGSQPKLIHHVDDRQITKDMDLFSVRKNELIKIDLTKYDLSDMQIGDADMFIDTMWYVPLETSDRCLIGETQKMEFDDSSFFVLDRYNAKGVFRFSLNGSFLNRIGQSGKGPGEYNEVTDFSLIDNKVAIYDQQTNKMSFYSKDGVFLYEKIMPFLFSQFVYCQPNSFYFYTFSAFNNHIPSIRNYNVIQCDSSFHINHHGFYVNKDHALRFNSEALHMYNNNIYYNEYYNDTVFMITDGRLIHAKYVFQLKDRIPQKLFVKGNELKFMYQSKQYNSFSSINAISDNYLIFRIKGKKNVNYAFFYSKITGKSFHGITFKGNNQLNPSHLKAMTCFGDTFAGLYQTHLIKQTIKNNPNLSPKLKIFVENIPETDNPILTYFKLKLF